MPTVKRKRGGQPGNQNARKHGFYSTENHLKVSKDKDVIDRSEAAREIAALRAKLTYALHVNPGNSRVLADAARQLTKIFRYRHFMDKEDYAVLKKFIRLATGKAAHKYYKTNEAESRNTV